VEGAEPLPQIEAAQFFAADLRVGRVLECLPFPQARVPAYRLRIDFGPMGERSSSARVVDGYRPEELTGSLVVCAVNLPPRQIGPARSEVLVLGAYERGGQRVALLRPDGDCVPGDRIG